jgi:hypothetical protein
MTLLQPHAPFPAALPQPRRVVIRLGSLAFLLAAAGPGLFAQDPCSGIAAVESLGWATPGSAGLPSLAMGGAPCVGGPFQLRVHGAEPLAEGWLILGSAAAPQLWVAGGALVFPGGNVRMTPFVADATGSSAPALAIARVPAAACGLEVVAQAAVLDASASGGFALTKAARFRVGAQSSPPAFEPPLGIAPGLPVYCMAVADIDGDQIADAVIGTAGEAFAFAPGLGGGAFGAAQLVPAGSELQDFVVVDLNQDQIPDVAAGANLIWQPSDPVSVVLGLGGGAFAAPYFIPTAGDGPGSVSAGDVNGDGFPDLAVVTLNSAAGLLGGGKVEIDLGNGDGTFAAPLVSVPGDGPQSAELADLDLDGFLDVVTSDKHDPTPGGPGPPLWGLEPVLGVMLGHGDGTLGAVALHSAPGTFMRFVVRDVTVDGIPDVVVANNEGSSIETFVGLSGGDLGPPLSTPMPSGGMQITVDDFDGDLWPDVAGMEGAYGFLVAGSGDGTFGPWTELGLTPGLTWQIASGDLDADLDADLITSGSILAPDVFVLENRLVP